MSHCSRRYHRHQAPPSFEHSERAILPWFNQWLVGEGSDHDDLDHLQMYLSVSARGFKEVDSLRGVVVTFFRRFLSFEQIEIW